MVGTFFYRHELPFYDTNWGTCRLSSIDPVHYSLSSVFITTPKPAQAFTPQVFVEYETGSINSVTLSAITPYPFQFFHLF